MKPLSNSLTKSIHKSQLIIIASKVLGPESVSHHGFDWQLLPITIEHLKVVLENWMAIEIEWCSRIAMWKEQGTIDDEIVSEPGIVVWLVELKDKSLDLSIKNELSLSTLLQIANTVAAIPAHIDYEFKDDVCANKILLRLNNIEPIKF